MAHVHKGEDRCHPATKQNEGLKRTGARREGYLRVEKKIKIYGRRSVNDENIKYFPPFLINEVKGFPLEKVTRKL